LFYFCLDIYSLSFISLPFEYAFGFFVFDEFNLFVMTITAMTFFFASVYAWGYVEALIEHGELHRENLKLFYAAFSLLLTFINLALAANNLALFLIFIELTTITGSLLIVTLNAKENIDAAIKYIFVTSTSMVFTLMGLILLTRLTNGEHLDWAGLLANPPGDSPLLLMTFILIIIGFLAKTGIAPFHTWLPHAHSMAPSVVSTVLSGTVLNVGFYGIIRLFSVVRNTVIGQTISQLLVFFGLLSMFIGVFSMLQQRDLKKLIAFSSIEQLGFMVIAVGVGTRESIFWVLYYMFAHSMIKALLFLSAGILHRQYRGNEIASMIDVIKLQPVATLGLVVGGVAVVGIPPFALFLPKFSILSEIGGVSLLVLGGVLFFFLLSIAAFAVILTQMVSQLPVHEDLDMIKLYRAPIGMRIPIIVLCILVFAFGIMLPESMVNLMSEIVNLLHLGDSNI
ncbi:MAG TPA: proton-conducting transporter membrane subunit, partial [Candidatus Hodarchaeales archaeon]|nr:proton-conducting transporter membrane subunit [Candidatus Hodarchaeales archaeon]